jgi:hypothetical protein
MAHRVAHESTRLKGKAMKQALQPRGFLALAIAGELR